HFPGEPRHHLAAVGAAHADREHPEAAAVGRVGVGADHEPAGEGVVLENDLVDDPGARLPEADPVFPRGRAEEVVDLLVLADRASQVVRENERSEEHTSELQSLAYLVCRLLLEKKKKKRPNVSSHANIKEPLSTV